LSALAMSSMPSVVVGFVHHIEAVGSESLGQLLRDEVSSCHGVRIAAGGPVGQCRLTAGKSAKALVKTLKWVPDARPMIGDEKRHAPALPPPGEGGKKTSAAYTPPPPRIAQMQGACAPPPPP